MRILLLIILAGAVYGCTSTSSDNSQQTEVSYGECGKLNSMFGGDWFDYYKRAITWMDCAQWQEAERDLRKALSIRNTDKRRVYTLGMHFLNNYFPNRELGVTLYNQQRYDEAIEFLMLSFTQFPSEKARQYLVNAIGRSAAYRSKDTVAPAISVTSQTNNDFTIEIKDDSFVDRIAINGLPFIVRDSKVIDGYNVAYSPLQAALMARISKADYEGLDINITATDATGRTTSLSIPSTLDNQPPDIRLLRRESNGQMVTWHFEVSDNSSDVISATINDEQIDIADNKITWSSDSPSVSVEVADAFGNAGRYQFKTKVSDSLFIDISDYASTTQNGVAVLPIYVGSANRLKSLIVGDMTMPLPPIEEQYINIKVPLKLGINDIPIQVIDEKGSQFAQVTVTRQPPLKNRPDEKLKLAAFPFDCNDGVQTCDNEAGSFDRFYQQLLTKNRFNLLSRKNISERIQQLKLCEFSVTEKCAWEATQLVGSQAMLFVEATRRSTPTGEDIELYAKFIDAVSGETLIAFDSYEQLDNGTFADMDILTNKIVGYFPYLQFTPDNRRLSLVNGGFEPWHNMPVFATKDKAICHTDKLNRKDNGLTLASDTRCQFDAVYSL